MCATQLTNKNRALAFHYRRNYHATARSRWLSLLPQSPPRRKENMVDNRRRACALIEENAAHRSCWKAALDKGKSEENSSELAYLPSPYVIASSSFQVALLLIVD